MTHPSRRKGEAFERAVVEYMRTHGLPYAERAYGQGRPVDVGDIDGIPGVCISCKDVARNGLSEWMDEASQQGQNGRKALNAVIWKRRRRPLGETYVTMTLDSWCAWMAEES